MTATAGSLLAMNTTAETTEQTGQGRQDEIAERLFAAATGAFELSHVWLGLRLGLYAAMAHGPEVTPGELAAKAGIAERYAREWLEEQAVAGLVDVAADADDPSARRYRLADDQAAVLVDEESPWLLGPVALGVVGIARTLPEVLDAFRSGSGVPYASYGRDVRDCISRLNRPMFKHQLAAEWLAGMPDLLERLTAASAPRIADLGCGTGWSSIELARAFPRASVDGLDSDPSSVEEARRNAKAAGVEDRVRFHCVDGADSTLAGPYDLVCAFECVHDFAQPVAVLRAARRSLASGGVVLIGDERAADSFQAPGDELERFLYGWSAIHCLPATLAEPDSAGTGTVMRTATLRDYAKEAGLTRFEVLPVEHDFWRFYRLEP
jgi:SAM-dependent methyltransferase